MADPYAIYARKILGIRELDALDEETDASLFGNIVHKGLENFFSLDRDFAAPDAAAGLTAALQAAMMEERPRAALEQWWAARLQRMAGWIVSAEAARRAQNPPVALSLEQEAELAIPGGFTLTGRADRIEKRADGTVMIMDYKTGTPPDTRKVEAGTAPQLPLEAVMAEAGAFGPEFRAEVTELRFWKLSGRHLEGEDKPICPKTGALRAVIDTAAAALPAQFAKFANPATPYLAAPHPDRKTYADVYKGISRRGEWGGDGDDDDPA
jgi:ATP-dependent helicase/nuclease subunit B